MQLKYRKWEQCLTMSEHIAYAAGLIDGEGSITVSKHTDGRSYTPYIVVNMTDKSPVEFCYELFGGRFYHQNRFYKSGKKAFVWTTGSRKITIETINLILPYLRGKRNQAEEILRSEWKNTSPFPVPEIEQNLRKEIFLNLREMKKGNL